MRDIESAWQPCSLLQTAVEYALRPTSAAKVFNAGSYTFATRGHQSDELFLMYLHTRIRGFYMVTSLKSNDLILMESSVC